MSVMSDARRAVSRQRLWQNELARGLNELWNKGGLQYAPPVR